tara:strand:+ start:22689 stop:22910 length:222 start_codon:yes stop_codon:yes gene_type:complete
MHLLKMAKATLIHAQLDKSKPQGEQLVIIGQKEVDLKENGTTPFKPKTKTSSWPLWLTLATVGLLFRPKKSSK